jgi:hypothetical protein
MSFDWEFEEEPPPGDPPRPDGASSGPRRFLRRWGPRLLALLAIITLGAVLWHRQRQHLVREAETQLRAVVDLELQAIADRDAEILRRLQDPGDRIWRERQVARYALPGQPAFVPVPGLEPSERSPEIREIALTGRRAEVHLVRWFQDPLAADPEPLSFGLLWRYRQDERGDWFHVAPADEVLDAQRTLSATVQISGVQKHVVGFTALGQTGGLGDGAAEGDRYLVESAMYSPRLAVHATPEEARLLQSKVDGLAELLRRACQTLSCPNGAAYRLDFADIPQPQISGGRWSLPALYLAGIPNTQASIDAWERALGRWLLEALARTQAEGLERRILYWKLVERIQAQLGLRPQETPDVQPLARALAEDRQHAPGEVWVAEYALATADDNDSPLYEAEAAALLDLLAERTGEAGLSQLPAALRRHFSPPESGLFDAFELDADEFTAAWFDRLSQLTGVPVTPFSTFPPAPASGQWLAPPPDPSSPARPPGDQVAMICDGRVWVGNADGSEMQPLTAEGEQFAMPFWSPDGRWLAVRWLHAPVSGWGALYLLAADGGSGRLLTDDPLADSWLYHWSPDGHMIIFSDRTSVLGKRLESGPARLLPGLPVWSPDGSQLVYSSLASARVMSAGADWADAREIAAGPAFFSADPWSPDGQRLALDVYGGNVHDNIVGIYDLASQRLDPLFTPVELAQALDSVQGEVLTNLSEPVDMTAGEPRYISSGGWSADGSRLLARVAAGNSGAGDDWSRLLLVVPADGGPARLVAYTRGLYLTAFQWSPQDPAQLLVRWTGRGQNPAGPNGFLFDLDAGLLYSATQVSDVNWSPDGAWAALSGPAGIDIVEKDGQRRFVLAPEAFGGAQRCDSLAWNPVADLSHVGED